jgi:predicted ribosome quality control (RQC) complex YloA/Tae2 family protein
MTEAEKIQFEHRLTETEDRSKSNTKRLNEHEEKLKENSDLILAIKELAMETKYLRKDLNETIEKFDEHERREREKETKDGDTWDKFKWLIVTGVVTIILGYLAVSVGLK